MRILLVDDDAAFLDVSSRFLKRYDSELEISTATSGREALDLIQEVRYDAIVADYQMPEMDGLEFLERLRNNGDDTPFIVFTGRGREEIAIRALNLGASHYVKKGGDPKSQYIELAHIIRNAVAHKRAESSLRDSEEKYRAVVEGTLQGILIVRSTSPPVVYANQRVKDISGYTVEELLSLSYEEFSKIIYEEDRTMVLGRLAERLQGKNVPNQYEHRINLRNGKVRWVELFASRIEFDGEPAVLASIIDIDDQKRLQDEIRRSAEKYRKLFDSSRDGIAAVDDNGQITSFNSAFEEMVGYTSEEIYSLTYQDLTPETWHDMEEEILRNQVDVVGFSKIYQKEYIRKDGSVFPVELRTYLSKDADGNPSGYWAFVRDITDRAETEKYLQESEERYRLMADTIRDGLTIIEGLPVVYANERVCEIFGYPEEEFKKKRTIELVAPEDKEKVAAVWDHAMKTGEYPENLEFWAVRKDGSRCYVSNRFSVTTKDDGTVIRYIVTTDETERRIAEEALREEKERAELYLEMAGVIFLALDTKGAITLINRRGCEILRCDEEGLIGKSWFDIVPERYREEVRANFEKLISGEVKGYEYIERPVLAKDGTEKIIVWHTTTLLDDEGEITGIISSGEDVTQRIEVKQELRKSAEIYKTLVKSLVDLIFVLDDQDRFVAFYGSPERTLVHPEEFIDKKLNKVMPQQVGELYHSTASKVRANGRSGTFVYPLSYGEEELWFKATLSLHDDGQSIVAVVRDVTDEKRTEWALRESERKYRMLYENIPEGFSRVDLEGKYIESNDAYLEIIGYTRKELQGLSYFDLTPERYHDIERKILEDQILRRGFSELYEKEYRRKDGSLIPVEIRIFLTRDSEGNPTGTWSIVRDITERKKVEEERNAAEEALLRKNKELSDFAHSMSHDLRGSFHNILGYSELLLDEYDSSMVEKIIMITHRMQDLLERSVELADAGLVVDTDQQVNLHFLVNSIAETVIPEGVSFKSDKLPIVFGDQDKIGQIVSNILINALEHGDPKSIEVRVKESDGAYALYFINDGAVINDDIQAKIFNKGFTTKRQGRGLGLTIVQKIVEAHGWEISLEERFPTIFRITIPKE